MALPKIPKRLLITVGLESAFIHGSTVLLLDELALRELVFLAASLSFMDFSRAASRLAISIFSKSIS